MLTALSLAFVLALPGATATNSTNSTNSTGDASCAITSIGYQCFSAASHHWGAYSPWFSLAANNSNSKAVSSDQSHHGANSSVPRYDAALPPGCSLSQVQLLSRHGARYPTTGSGKRLAKVLHKIQKKTTHFAPDFALLAHLHYNLSTNSLTPLGERELSDSGAEFYHRYAALTRRGAPPFVRSSSEQRVRASAQHWIDGYTQARKQDHEASDRDSVFGTSVVLSEAKGSNNTLDPGTCAAYENDNDHGAAQQKAFRHTAFRPIAKRVNTALRGANLRLSEVVDLMELCPFLTVAATTAADAQTLSPVCGLFSAHDWEMFDYYQTLGKYYGHGSGNEFGVANGIGWVHELEARLTGTPVNDDTTTNHTLDSSNATFPLGRALYADFSHDNAIMAITAALDLFPRSAVTLPTDHAVPPAAAGGFAAPDVVPFAARLFVEKLACGGTDYVRLLLNDRVVAPGGCSPDSYGRCRLDDFLGAMPRGDGGWGRCFAKN